MTDTASLVSRRASRLPQPSAHEALAHQAHCEGECNESQVERETLASKVEALQSATIASASAREKL